uniref:Uncharacterized protein n=1 Tax=Ignisphaera aggregans TaxID=334771 RepID=A0A7C4FCS8_9CREN
MRVQFPFFANLGKGGVASYYCASIIYNEKESKLTIKLYRVQYDESIVYSPITHPDAIDTSRLNNYIECCEEEFKEANAIVVRHEVHESRGSKKAIKVHIIIAYEREGEKDNQRLWLSYLRGISKINNEEEEYNIFIISSKRRYVPYRNNRNASRPEDKVLVAEVKAIDIIKYGGVHSSDKIRIGGVSREAKEQILHHIEINQDEELNSVELNRIRTWSLILQLPISIELLDKKLEIENLKVTSIKLNMIEGLLGSNVIAADRHNINKQIPSIIPTPLLSALSSVMTKTVGNHSGYSGSPILTVLPSIFHPNVGGIMLQIDLTPLFEKLYCYLYNKMLEVGKLQINAKISKARYVDLYGFSCGNIDLGISAEALLKALTSNFVLHRPRIYISSKCLKKDNKDNITELSSWIRLPHRIRRIDVGIPVEGTSFQQAVLSSTSTIYLAYEVVRNRVRYLRKLLKYVRDLKQLLPNNYNINNTKLLLLAFASYIGERVEKYCKGDVELQKVAEKTPLVGIYIPVIASRIALLLLLLGLHGLSHLLLKYLYADTKTRGDRLREFVILSIDKKYIRNRAGLSQYYVDVVINGFTYLLSNEEDKIIGTIIISDTKPYTSTLWKEITQRFDIDRFIEFAYHILRSNQYDDKCLGIWRDMQKRVKMFTELWNWRVIIDKAVTILSEDYKLGDPQKGRLTLPLIDARVIISEDVINKLEDNAKNIIKHHLESLYVMAMPFCFDGCYNCIVLDKGCRSNPLMKEWTVSKSITRIIIDEIRNNL